MSIYTEYYFRSPDTATFLSDVESVCQNNGIDPYARGILRKDEDGNTQPGRGVDVIPAGRWWDTEPQWDYSTDHTTQTQEGVTGDYALINVLTKDPDLEQLAESFAASDPAKDPVDIPDSEKIGSGTHRINGSMLSTPARTW